MFRRCCRSRVSNRRTADICGVDFRSSRSRTRWRTPCDSAGESRRRDERRRRPIELISERRDHRSRTQPDRVASYRVAASDPHGLCERPTPTSRDPCPRSPGSRLSIVRRRAESNPAAFIFSLWQAMRFWFRNARCASVVIAGAVVGAVLARRVAGAAGGAGRAGSACGRAAGAGVVVGAGVGRADCAWTAKAARSAATQPTTSDLIPCIAPRYPSTDRTNPKCGKASGLNRIPEFFGLPQTRLESPSDALAKA